MKVRKLAVVGGTHGNEYTGSCLLKMIHARDLFSRYATFSAGTLLANPKACERNVRFMDADLNRSFFHNDLEDAARVGYEADRAKTINQVLGPKGNPTTDLIIDVHTTTTNMGFTVILSNLNEYNLNLAAHLASRFPDCSILHIPAQQINGKPDHSFLNSLTALGYALELGPIPNGIIRHDLLGVAFEAVQASLDFIESMNLGQQSDRQAPLDYLEIVKPVYFPLDANGAIAGIVHQKIQDKDFQPISTGTPIFETWDGAVELYEDDEELYPIFINEAGYYILNIAFSLARRKTSPVPCGAW